jgi:hypothetical protein
LHPNVASAAAATAGQSKAGAARQSRQAAGVNSGKENGPALASAAEPVAASTVAVASSAAAANEAAVLRKQLNYWIAQAEADRKEVQRLTAAATVR